MTTKLGLRKWLNNGTESFALLISHVSPALRCPPHFAANRNMRPTSPQRLVSVVMPVHNALPHLDDAVRSILAQSYTAFEFVIYDDASSDGSTKRLRQWAAMDRRIRLFEGESNLGPAVSSNWVAGKASAALVARMDADDISHPDRLRRQVELLEENPDVGLVGALCEIIDRSGRCLRKPEVWRLVRKSWFAPFPHGSIMYRADIFDRAGGYRAACEYWEDQDLVTRMSRITDILVVPEALYKHRQSAISTRLSSGQQRVERAVDLMYRSIERLSHGRDYDDLLSSDAPRRERIDPRVFVALGSLALWSGNRPDQLGPLLRRGDLTLNMRTLLALAWTSWAAISPASLRLCLRALVLARNIGRASPGNEAAVRWSAR